MRLSLVCVCAIGFGTPTAFSDPSSEQEHTGWIGEGAISASSTSGNASTTDLGLTLHGERSWKNWEVILDLTSQYGEVEGEEAKNRFVTGSQLNRSLSDRMFGFASASYEQDEFSGFANRTFAGAGIGYDLLRGDGTRWSLESGPGFKSDTVRSENAPDDVEQAVSMIGRSKFRHRLGESAKLTQSAAITYAPESTQIEGDIALTTQINHSLSARISYEVRYDTDVPAEFESTDTATRFSVVYTFGD